MTAPDSRRYLAIWLPMLAEDIWRLDNKILPGTGRGTMRSMVEGHCGSADLPLHRTSCGPPPQALLGEDLPIVFVEKLNNAMRVTALTRSALALGLAPGLTLADARARAPELVALDRNHAAEARLLARIVVDCVRYTPMAASEPPDGVILDITGCTHAFDGEQGLKADLDRRLGQGGITARLALGDTPEQARALARFGRDGGDLLALPVEALEAEPATTLALRRAGLKRIGDLSCRPRKMLAARFGDLAIRLGRLLGEQDQHISPQRPLPAIFALRRFAEPIARVEDALACIEQLAVQAAETLRERHQGGRRFVARLFRSDGAIAVVEIITGQPTRDPALLIRLFRERIDALADPIDPGFGFDLVRLDVPATEPLAARQDDYTAPPRHEEKLAELVDRLSARLGARRISRARPENSHIPECAAVCCAPAQVPVWEPVPQGEPPLRPLRLFDPPQPIGAVMSEVPDGPPMRFTWRGRNYSIARWEGPERIAAEWWRRRDRGGRPRDYYRVEDADGHRFWLFRHGLHAPGGAEPDWYIHGLFA
ncbi:MAG TPA: DNA polymerase Y family protein [Sphingomonas sp.]|nr:DNA polymerase Y family protein [Sphingomonas sp.]